MTTMPSRPWTRNELTVIRSPSTRSITARGIALGSVRAILLISYPTVAQNQYAPFGACPRSPDASGPADLPVSCGRPRRCTRRQVEARADLLPVAGPAPEQRAATPGADHQPEDAHPAAARARGGRHHQPDRPHP